MKNSLWNGASQSIPLNVNVASSVRTLNPHQASYQPQLTLTGTPLTFNLVPKFLGVTFDRTLSFDLHVQSLRTKFFPLFNVLRSIASASWGPSKETLSQLYKTFIRPVFSHASPGWCPFPLWYTEKKLKSVLQKCLPTMLLLESPLPRWKSRLNH